MWKKQDDAVGAQPDFASKQTPDLALLGDALVQSIVNDTSVRLKGEQIQLVSAEQRIRNRQIRLQGA
jgi:hypothetical protein